jgi:hypothetical protein
MFTHLYGDQPYMSNGAVVSICLQSIYNDKTCRGVGGNTIICLPNELFGKNCNTDLLLTKITFLPQNHPLFAHWDQLCSIKCSHLELFNCFYSLYLSMLHYETSADHSLQQCIGFPLP